jgi:hypothetical protein
MSPRVLQLDQLHMTVKIFWKERHGPHCHVIAPGAKASFDLVTLECLVSAGFSEVALNRIQKALRQYQTFLMEKWNEIQEESKN